MSRPYAQFDEQMMRTLKNDLYGDYEMKKCKGKLHTLILTEQDLPSARGIFVNGMKQYDGIESTTPMRSRAFAVRGGIVASTSSMVRGSQKSRIAASKDFRTIEVNNP